MILVFWIAVFIIFYTFVGYGMLLYAMVKLKRLFIRRKPLPPTHFPTVTLIVAAYNEADIIEEKIDNTLSLNYPQDKLQIIFVTDGSTDDTPKLIAAHSSITLMHQEGRSGKINAVHRAMQNVNSEIAVFTDANTFLNADALIEICRHYADETIGAVSGEKRVQAAGAANAAATEGVYWKYESKLKTWDAELYSVVGAAGELFSIRTALYQGVPADTILDDFMISLLITKQGYRIAYEPKAFATEAPSHNVREELKRKIRIAAGGIQSIVRLPFLLNPFFNPPLAFQYISHRVLRWTITPFLLIVVFVVNIAIVWTTQSVFYTAVLVAQLLFYGMALAGFALEQRQLRKKIFFIPYYFCLMNYAVIAGIGRYFGKRQSAVWEKAKRSK